MIDATAAVQQLAVELGAKPSIGRAANDDGWSLDAPPDWLHQRMPYTAMSNLPLIQRAGLAAVEELCRLRQVPSDHWCDYGNWWPLLSAVGAEIVMSPAAEPELRALFHELSGRPGAFSLHGVHASGYDEAANDAALDEAVDRSAKRIVAGDTFKTLTGIMLDLVESGIIAAGMAPGLIPPVAGAMGGRLHISHGFDVMHKRRSVAGGLGLRGEVTLIIGPGGIAKSTVVTLVCMAVAAGTEHAGPLGHPPLCVLMINGEDQRGEVTLRYQATLAHHRLSTQDVGPLHIAGADDPDVAGIALTEVDRETGRARVNKSGIARLRQLVVEIGAQLLVLDPLAAFVTAGVNENEVAAAVLVALKRVAAETDCAIVLVAHTKKGAAAMGDNAEATLGAVAWVNLSRGVRLVRKSDAKTLRDIGAMPGEDGDIREVIAVKANMGPTDARQFFKIVGVPMNNATAEYPEADWVGVAEVFTPRTPGSQFTAQALEAVLRTLAQGVGGGTTAYSASARAVGRFYGDAVGRALAPFFASVHPSRLTDVAKTAYAECSAQGWVVEVPVKVAKPGSTSTNTKQGIAVLWTQSPFATQPMPGPFAT